MYSNLTGKVTKETLLDPRIQRDFHRALPVFKQYIAVTGGSQRNAFGIPYHQKSTFFYNLATNEYIDGPEMNVGRRSHGQCQRGYYLYVFGGRGEGGWLNSIECLEAKTFLNGTEKQWERLDNFNFSTRRCPLVCKMPDGTILIAGGWNNIKKELDDVMFVNKDRSITLHKQMPGMFRFDCTSQPTVCFDGSMVSFVQPPGTKYELILARYDPKANEFENLGNF
eukprot:CAMPEP_0170453174 /NCGR_PEP_ID=MMETSP0123-20130129/1839_1 /TAXON_ID=182087 /ORGANISM="Favella ehrenbergii, Strain Fehren 1" /LENGTH=223 /DNA_ID=CAMNT_0010715449 /DNA_START=693 /DNA_END=1364 /DNA_ORIENTATION=+